LAHKDELVMREEFEGWKAKDLDAYYTFLMVPSFGAIT